MKKKLLVLPRPDGLNNQLQDIYRTLHICYEYGFDFVCPDLYDYVQNNRTTETVFPFDFFFGTEEMGFPFQMLSMPRKQGLLERVLFFSLPKVTYVGPAGSLEEEATHKLFRRYSFQNKISEVIEANKLSDAVRETRNAKNDFIIFSNQLLNNVNFGDYSDYRRGQGWSVDESDSFKNVYSRFVPSRHIQGRIDAFSNKFPAFNALHLRRGDYVSKRQEIGQREVEEKTLESKFGSESFFQKPEHILRLLSERFDPAVPVFLASEDPSHVREELSGGGYEFFTIRDFPEILDCGVQDIIGIIEVRLCGIAEKFIGNRYSSFSAAIVNLRRLSSKKSSFW